MVCWLQQSQGGGAAPMPAPGEGQEPVLKKGGKLVRRKCAKKQGGGAVANLGAAFPDENK